MKQLVVLTNGKVPKIKNATVLTFDEELERRQNTFRNIRLIYLSMVIILYLEV